MNLYFETYSGIAGDMTIGALLDLGADKEVLIKALESMDFGDYKLDFKRIKKNGIDAFKFDVILEEHHHDHGECKCGGKCKNHSHNGEHDHDHYDHHHEPGHVCQCNSDSHHHSHHHEHRNLADVIRIIESGDFSDKVKNDAKNIFEIIAKAESKAHGVEISEVHFHEVGAVDSIIDIVGTCVLIENLGVEKIYSTELYEGYGFVKCAHGSMPVPVPAVINILNGENIPLNIIDDEGEHITPTGAAIIAYFSEGKPDFSFTINKVGVGAGTRDFENTTNIVRIMEISNSKKKESK